MLLLMDDGNRWDEKKNLCRDLFFPLADIAWKGFSIHTKWEWKLATERIIKIDCDNLEMKKKRSKKKKQMEIIIWREWKRNQGVGDL